VTPSPIGADFFSLGETFFVPSPYWGGLGWGAIYIFTPEIGWVLTQQKHILINILVQKLHPTNKSYLL